MEIEDFDKKIPLFYGKLEWEKVVLVENSEALVNLSRLSNLKMKIESKYYLDNIPGAIKDIYVRESLVKKLEYAAGLLPVKMRLLIWDGWRPERVQKWLYNKSVNFKKKEGVTEKSIPAEAEKFAANPKNNNKTPPHSTGGAVDVALVDDKGKLIPMGTELDYFGEPAITTHFEKKNQLSKEEQEFRKNRRLLYWVMIQAGFTNYPMEWWHYDYGNQLWGLLSNEKAFYGATKIDTT